MLVEINLLPEKEKERSTLLLAALVILGVAILIWILIFISSSKLAKETESIERELSKVQQHQEEIRSTLQTSELVSDKKALIATVEWAENYRLVTIPVLRELTTLLPLRGFFTEFEFSGPHEAVVKVQFDTSIEAAHYLSRLKGATVVSDVVLDSVETEDLTNEDDTNSKSLLPRYVATYTIQIVDERLGAEGTAQPSLQGGEETDDQSD